MIFNNFINQKYSQINIPIYPLYHKTENDVKFIHNLEQFIKDSFNTKYNLSSLLSEKKSLVFRRSLYISSDVKKGTVLSPENVRCVRPGLGLPPKYLDLFLGKKLMKDVKRGTPLNWDLIF